MRFQVAPVAADHALGLPGRARAPLRAVQLVALRARRRAPCRRRGRTAGAGRLDRGPAAGHPAALGAGWHVRLGAGRGRRGQRPERRTGVAPRRPRRVGDGAWPAVAGGADGRAAGLQAAAGGAAGRHAPLAGRLAGGAGLRGGRHRALPARGRRQRWRPGAGRSTGSPRCAPTAAPTSWPTAGRRSRVPAVAGRIAATVRWGRGSRVPSRRSCSWATPSGSPTSWPACERCGRGAWRPPWRSPRPSAWSSARTPGSTTRRCSCRRSGSSRSPPVVAAWPWQDRWLLAAAYAVVLLWPLGGFIGIATPLVVVLLVPAVLLGWGPLRRFGAADAVKSLPRPADGQPA